MSSGGWRVSRGPRRPSRSAGRRASLVPPVPRSRGRLEEAALLLAHQALYLKETCDLTSAYPQPPLLITVPLQAVNTEGRTAPTWPGSLLTGAPCEHDSEGKEITRLSSHLHTRTPARLWVRPGTGLSPSPRAGLVQTQGLSRPAHQGHATWNLEGWGGGPETPGKKSPSVKIIHVSTSYPV